MAQHSNVIEVSFEHYDSAGDCIETLIAIDFTYTSGSPGRLYGEPGDCYPAEAAEWEYDGASWRDAGGKWHAAAPGDFIDMWAAAKLALMDAADIEDVIPSSGPDPDEMRDAAYDREMSR